MTATGGSSGAGIGGGREGKGENITITGGTVNATGNEDLSLIHIFRELIDSRSFSIIFKENYCSFLILEAGIFFMAAESRAWGSWAP